jgi:hypothetical protein
MLSTVSSKIGSFMTFEGHQPGKRCFFCAFLQNIYKDCKNIYNFNGMREKKNER